MLEGTAKHNNLAIDCRKTHISLYHVQLENMARGWWCAEWFQNDKSPIYVGIIVIGRIYVYIYITRFKLSPNKNSNIDINTIILLFTAWHGGLFFVGYVSSDPKTLSARDVPPYLYSIATDAIFYVMIM